MPASDEVLRKEFAPECEKALGIKLNIEMINGNDLQARTTSEFNRAVDLTSSMIFNNWPQLYAESVVDVSDLAEEIGKEGGSTKNRAPLPTTARNGSPCRGPSSVP